MKNLKETKIETEKAILMCASFDSQKEQESSVVELERLAETAGVKVVGKMFQRIKDIVPATFMGQGKIQELAQMVEDTGADVVIFDDELSGSQTRNISDLVKVKVIDRSTLILDIFAMRATSNEGKMQVELAQLKYRMPRLGSFGGGEGGRYGGGVGMRGPGETKLEVNRRVVKDNIAKLEKEIEKLDAQRKIRRKARIESGVKKVAIVGYTNAGKSTLFNCITKAGIYADDKLFATLDTTTRSLYLDEGKQVVITDTVGFINKLPHEFIKAFASTLEESVMADVIVHVVDISNPEYQKQMEVVDNVLINLGASNIPVIVAINKTDAVASLPARKDNEVFISAKNNIGIDVLKGKIVQLLWNE
ncbi:MAG: GTPase HflX [Clostridia bacterium]